MKREFLVIDACQFSANYNYCLLDAMAKIREKITYATTRSPYENIPDPEGVRMLHCFFYLARITVKFTSSGSIRRFLRAIEYPLDWFILLTYIIIKRIKIVHFMWVVSPSYEYWIIKFLQLLGLRVVYTAHNHFPHEQKMGDLKKYSRIYKTANHIITLTEYTRKEIVKHFNINDNKISVIPHGDFKALFSLYGLNYELAKKVKTKARDRKIITFLGHIRPYKGLEYLIEAFPIIKNRLPESFLLIAGSLLVGDKAQLEERIEQYCTSDDLWVDMRYIPIEDFKAYLSITNVLVQPYISASQSGNTIMAYSAGVPVISTNVGGLGEMTEDGKTGYVIKPKDAEAIAEAVIKCFQDNSYSQMSKEAKKVATERYNWSKIAQQTIDIYHRLATK